MTTGSRNENAHQASGDIRKIIKEAPVQSARVTLSAVIKSPKGIAGLLLSAGLIFLAGWLTGGKVTGEGQSSHGADTTPAQSRHQPSVVDGTPVGARVSDVGVLDGVTISGTWTKTPPKSQTQWYMVSVTFPRSDADCGLSCSQAVKDILGSDSCFGQTCVAELKDTDEGNKVNSSDIFGQCINYQHGKQRVLIAFSGRRDQRNSQYANILLVAPSA